MKYWVIDSDRSYHAKCDIQESLITLENGLIRRVIDSKRGSISFCNLMTGAELVEKDFADYELVVNGMEVDLYCAPCKIDIVDNIVDVPYKCSCTSTEMVDYPAKSVSVSLTYCLENMTICVIYQIFDNLPVICKRMQITNTSNQSITIDKVVVDKLISSNIDDREIYVETDFNGGCMLNNNRTLSVNYNKTGVCAYFEPNTILQANETFDSLRAYELLHFAKPYEQRMIEVKEMYRKLFPWVMDNPLIFHVTSDKTRRVKNAIGQAVAVGFDGVVQSFGSGINIENCSKYNIKRHKKLYDYAHLQGIKIGGYTLAIVKNYRRVAGPERNDKVGANGIFRCLATQWSQKYWRHIFNFYEQTGADLIEIDGPYHFYECDGGPTHLHKDARDSRYLQWKLSNKEVYKKFKELGVYVNAPDWHFLNGCNKCGIGYEEIAFSEPRQEQLLVHRIYNYKGTFNKIPSMGWGFLPIDVYHGGGSNAKFAPLDKNIRDYEWAVFQSIMSGVIPCFRGKKLFDGDASREMLKKWVAFYKKYKRVLNGTTIHFMPPKISENRCRTTDIDCIFNCVSSGDVRGVLAVFNQTDIRQQKSIDVPIFYTGLCDVDTIPVPYIGSSITKVAHPVYGECPPPFPTENEEDMWTPQLVTGTGMSQLLKEEEFVQPKAVKDIGRVLIADSEGKQFFAMYDSNANIKIDIDLPPMSYTYYIIYAKNDK